MENQLLRHRSRLAWRNEEKRLGFNKYLCAITRTDTFGGKVAVLDVDICGPSIPKLLRVENSEIVSTQWGWTPIKYDYTQYKILVLMLPIHLADLPFTPT